MTKKKTQTQVQTPPVAMTAEERAAAIIKREATLLSRGVVLNGSGTSRDYLRPELGVEGIAPNADGSGFHFPLALRLSGGEAAQLAIQAAVSRTSLRRLMATLAKGWTEIDSSSGAVQYLFSIPTDQAGLYGAIALASLAAQTAKGPGGVVLAELRTRKIAIAPSLVGGVEWELVSGGAVFTPITVSELAGIGAMIDSLSAAKDPDSRAVYDSRESSDRTNAARDFFNRSAACEELALSALTKAGWTVKDEGVDVPSSVWAPGQDLPCAMTGGEGIPAGTLIIPRSDADGPVTPERAGGLATGVYRAFDVISVLAFGGDDEAAAESMLEAGEARVEAEIFAAGGIVDVDIAQPNLAIVREVVRAVSMAKAAGDTRLPLAVQHLVAGSAAAGSPVLRGIVSVLPSGAIKIWTRETVDGLIASAVQAVRYYREVDPVTNKKGIAEYVPAFHSTVRNAVWDALCQPKALPVAEYVGVEPMITTAGDVVSRGGFSAREGVLLAMSPKAQARWAGLKAENVTQEQAQASFEWLIAEIAGSFPWVSDGDLARFMAYILTGVARPIIDVSPLWVASAGEVSSGKSYACETGRIIASGHKLSHKWRGGKENEKEDYSSIATAVLASSGSRCYVHNDEAVARSGKVESIAVSSGVTETDGSTTARLLGGNTSVTVSGVIFTAAGNGAAENLGGDLATRSVVFSMYVAGGGAAVLRTDFRHADLHEWIKTNRREILQNVFNILSHGIKNRSIVPAYRFGSWSEVVLGSMDHLTINGKNAHKLVMDRLEQQIGGTEESEELGALVAGLSTAAGNQPFEAREAAGWAQEAKLEMPYTLAASLSGEETAKLRTWSRELRKLAKVKTVYGGHRYVVTAHEPVAGKPNRFSIARYDLDGTAAPESATFAEESN